MAEIISLPLSRSVIVIPASGYYQLSAVQANISNPVIIEVDTNEFSVNLVLPPTTDGQSPLITIVDIGGNASGQPIGIFAYTPEMESAKYDLINGFGSGSISQDNGVVKIQCVTTYVWLATGNFLPPIGPVPLG
jgi:hypothetical protein